VVEIRLGENCSGSRRVVDGRIAARCPGSSAVVVSAGGKFEGPKLRGEIRQGGGDWTLFRPNGVMTLGVIGALRGPKLAGAHAAAFASHAVCRDRG
jgi:Protein of unknown function (DUF3237)